MAMLTEKCPECDEATTECRACNGRIYIYVAYYERDDYLGHCYCAHCHHAYHPDTNPDGHDCPKCGATNPTIEPEETDEP